MATITHDTAEVWESWQRRELSIVRCHACSTFVHPPTRMCPACWSDDVSPEVVDGAAHLLAFSFPRLAPGVTEPVVTGVVSLDAADGVRLLAPVVGCAPEDVATGMALTLTWGEVDGVSIPQFTPAEAGR